MNKDISIVVPVYNEEENILSFLIRVVAILEKCKFSYEIIFVLDPSIDRSEEIISNQIKLNKNIKMLVLSRRFGQPSATMAGILNCNGRTCVIIDVDLQDPPELIENMYFKFHRDLFFTAVPDSLIFKIIWLDKTPNSTWELQYYNSLGLQTAINVIGIGDNQWKTVSVTLFNPIINQSGILGSDFMLVNTDGIDDIFHGIEVDISRKIIIPSIQNPVDFVLFPNPANSIVYWDKKVNPDEIIFYNILGQKIFIEYHPINNSANLMTLKRGLYFLEFIKNKNRFSIKKMIKQ